MTEDIEKFEEYHVLLEKISQTYNKINMNHLVMLEYWKDVEKDLKASIEIQRQLSSSSDLISIDEVKILNEGLETAMTFKKQLEHFCSTLDKNELFGGNNG
jgi:ethanolamine utilization protein EutA (predicted chaperonin)